MTAAGYLGTAMAAGWTTASLLLGSSDRRRGRGYVLSGIPGGSWRMTTCT